MLELMPVVYGAIVFVWANQRDRRLARRDFLEKHGEEIRRENQQIAGEWSRARPGDESIEINRTIKQGLFAPKIEIKEVFRKP